jgi:Ca2+-binding EF-hand superfamily protein
MRINKLTLLAATFVIGLPVAALAYGGDRFKNADTNGDGIVDLTEFLAGHDKRFGDMDANADGFVTQDEIKSAFAKFHERHGDRFFDRLDTDKDGKISSAESVAMEAKHFQDMDADGDGFVTKDEAQAAMEKRGHKPHGDGSAFFDKADTDKDGKISKAESEANQQRRFQQMDANVDGFVTQEEAKAAFDKMRADHPKPADGQADKGQGFINRLDADKDGKISKAEWDQGGQQMFAKLDKNTDGKLTPDEMKHRHHGDKPAQDEAPQDQVPQDQAPAP